MQDNTQTIARSAKTFFSGALLSRLSGFGREVVMAAAFGTVPAVAAFWMAFRFAHLLRRLFGEGGLHVAFIPHFESLRAQDPIKASHFFYGLGMGLTQLLIGFVVCIELSLFACLMWGGLAPGNADVVRLTMIMLPAVIFICLFALNQSLLNCERSFFIPSVAPAALNCIWICAVIWLWDTPTPLAIERLSMIIVLAFALQWMITLPSVFRYFMAFERPYPWESKKKMGSELAALLRPFLLALLGVAATQINNALDALFARAADPEGPALLWYALRIEQLPLALLGVGLTGALLPPLSRAMQAQEKEKAHTFLLYSLKRAIGWMIPCTIGMIVTGFSAVNFVFGRGQFTPFATEQTTYCLWAYGLSLAPLTITLLLASTFYAQKSYRLPTLFSLLTVFFNCLLNTLLVFVFHLGAISIAIATTAAALLNMTLLGWALSKRENLSFTPLFPGAMKVFLCSLLAGGVTLLFTGLVLHDQTLPFLLNHPLPLFSRSPLIQLLFFSCGASCYGGILWALAHLFKVEELLALIPKQLRLA